MSANQMLKYHIGVPVAIIAGLLLVGIPFGTAFFVGMMAGCMSMMLMMGRRGRGDVDDDAHAHEDRGD